MILFSSFLSSCISREKKSSHQHYDLIVIGAGISGMVCALRASERGKKVLLVEKNLNLSKSRSGRSSATFSSHHLSNQENEKKRDGNVNATMTSLFQSSDIPLFVRLAIPIIIAVRSDQYSLPATVVGIFMIQLVIMIEYGSRLIFPSYKH